MKVCLNCMRGREISILKHKCKVRFFLKSYKLPSIYKEQNDSVCSRCFLKNAFPEFYIVVFCGDIINSIPFNITFIILRFNVS